MSTDAKDDSELGRSKQHVSPADHLMHLLTIGWSPNAPLIQKYVAENGLSRDLAQWQSIQGDFNARMPVTKPAGKSK
ncbi:MAG: hypothetical protein HYX67_13865 [Candidatus Melainabacteria bacterium]|nr:hypothetical protein [Candidatus Melainabacteria bacterium]